MKNKINKWKKSNKPLKIALKTGVKPRYSNPYGRISLANSKYLFIQQ